VATQQGSLRLAEKPSHYTALHALESGGGVDAIRLLDRPSIAQDLGAIEATAE